MCGIVGLHLKSPSLHRRLGELLTPMLVSMTSRGPDSAGIALYDDDLSPDGYRYSVRAADVVDADRLARTLTSDLGVTFTARQHADSAVLVAERNHALFTERLTALAPNVALVGQGHAIEVYKDVGSPLEICERYDIPKQSGYQALGHTRMATESAVTTEHSHPFAPGPDLALVHNGSFSNYATIRRRLMRDGIRFDTDNDSEVAARYIAWHMERGTQLEDALRMVLKDLDGFFTLLVATRTEFAVVRDSFACKPAVIAETDDYVAMASEYQALASLPGITAADVFEPKPEEIYLWSR